MDLSSHLAQVSVIWKTHLWQPWQVTPSCLVLSTPHAPRQTISLVSSLADRGSSFYWGEICLPVITFWPSFCLREIQFTIRLFYPTVFLIFGNGVFRLLLSCRLNIQAAVPWPLVKGASTPPKAPGKVSWGLFLSAIRTQTCSTFPACTGSLGICVTWVIRYKRVANESPWVFSQVSYCCWARWMPNLSYCSWNKWFC